VPVVVEEDDDLGDADHREIKGVAPMPSKFRVRC
jgi:hypothetical protein